jgi:hypothetical protein
MHEKKAFSARLKAALIAAGYEPRAGVLEKEFNKRYWGRSVTLQAARRWLVGLSIPQQDKLQILAEWLDVEPHVLRYGGPAGAGAREPRPSWVAGLKPQDRDSIEAFLALSMPDRKFVRELIDRLGQNEK